MKIYAGELNSMQVYREIKAEKKVSIFPGSIPRIGRILFHAIDQVAK